MSSKLSFKHHHLKGDYNLPLVRISWHCRSEIHEEFLNRCKSPLLYCIYIKLNTSILTKKNRWNLTQLFLIKLRWPKNKSHWHVESLAITSKCLEQGRVKLYTILIFRDLLIYRSSSDQAIIIIKNIRILCTAPWEAHVGKNKV